MLFLRKLGHTRAPNFSQPSLRATARLSLRDVPGSSVQPPNSSAWVASAFVSGRKTIPPHLTPHSLIKGSGLTKRQSIGAQFTPQTENKLGPKIYTRQIKEAIKNITKIKKKTKKTNLPI